MPLRLFRYLRAVGDDHAQLRLVQHLRRGWDDAAAWAAFDDWWMTTDFTGLKSWQVGLRCKQKMSELGLGP